MNTEQQVVCIYTCLPVKINKRNFHRFSIKLVVDGRPGLDFISIGQYFIISHH